MVKQCRKRVIIMAKAKNRNTEYAIKYLSETMKMEPATIAKEVGASIDEVNTIIANSQQEKIKSINSKDLMIRQTGAKGVNNVSVMTQAASSFNDEAVKNFDSAPKKDTNYIFRPNV